MTSFGIIVLLVAAVQGIGRYIRQEYVEARTRTEVQHLWIRREFGERILLGLEFFVAADIIRSMVTPGFAELGQLAVIVAIRVALGYFLEREIHGFE
ncbi:MAG: DUF1622 domain-containing protein [Actinobacteria bacterium]|nr:MAG: DUF1622 domain-containing protein [Actinomycetota bacterium]